MFIIASNTTNLHLLHLQSTSFQIDRLYLLNNVYEYIHRNREQMLYLSVSSTIIKSDKKPLVLFLVSLPLSSIFN